MKVSPRKPTRAGVGSEGRTEAGRQTGRGAQAFANYYAFVLGALRDPIEEGWREPATTPWGGPRSWFRLGPLQAVLVAAALAVLAYRFLNLDLRSFILDEPQFLDAAREQLRTGQWLSASPLVGTQGLRYGPSVLWFYGVVHSLFGDRASISITAMCAMLSLAHLALAVALTRLFRGGPLFFALLLAWIASSPYQFFWSRLAWDQTVNVCASWAVVILCVSTSLGLASAAGLGLVLGIALSSHPMVLPFVVAVGLTIAFELRRQPGRLALYATVTGLGILLVNLPYLSYLGGSSPRLSDSAGFSWGVWLEYVLQPARAANLWGIEYFFDADWTDFWTWLGPTRALFGLRPLTLILTLLAAATGIGLALRAPEAPQRRIARLALLLWIIGPLFYAARSIDWHPHYQFANWWLISVGVAAVLAWTRNAARTWQFGLRGFLAGVALVQTVFLVEWMHYVRERGGTRGIHYSSTLGTQTEVIRKICAYPETFITVSNETILWPFPLLYGSSTEPACRGKHLVVCRSGRCPAPGPSARLVRLHYSSERGGALSVDGSVGAREPRPRGSSSTSTSVPTGESGLNRGVPLTDRDGARRLLEFIRGEVAESGDPAGRSSRSGASSRTARSATRPRDTARSRRPTAGRAPGPR